MKKIFPLTAVLFLTSLHAQFNLQIETSPQFKSKEAILYSLDGSKDLILSKENRVGNAWNFKVSKPYSGMLKIYFPDTNNSLNLISENKDVKIQLNTTEQTLKTITYLDDANLLMEKAQDIQNKSDKILPALVQIKEFYSPQSTFSTALNAEIARLQQDLKIDAQKNPFVYYYYQNYNKFVAEKEGAAEMQPQQIVDFITSSNEMLETSSLLRPILVNYLNAAGNAKSDQAVDALLGSLGIETPRGQTVLSEFIDIFGAYGLSTLKDKYLTLAKNLKCTITPRLATTLQSNKNVELGATFPNTVFTVMVKNTTAKSLREVKAAQKIIMFWSSTCSHCEKDLPVLLEKYITLKSKNIEIVGLSLDADKASYEAKVKMLPWINDSELKGWNSSYSQVYNVTATPTYYILDAENKIVATPDTVSDVFMFLNLK